MITPVAVDHAHILGADPVTIARDKAGIIKPGGTTVMSQQSLDVFEVLLAKAAEVGSPGRPRRASSSASTARSLAVGGQLISIKGLGGEYDEIFLPLHGEYQAHNAATAVAAVEALLGAGPQTEGRVTTELLQAGFAEVDQPGPDGGRPDTARRSSSTPRTTRTAPRRPRPRCPRRSRSSR